MRFTKASFVALLGATVLPFITFAQTTTTVTDLPSLFNLILSFINTWVVPIVFAIAFVVFIFGIFRYFIQNGGNPEKTAEGRQFLLWSLIGFFVMFSVWGLINLFVGTLSFNQAQPNIPTFTNTTGATSGASGSSILNSLGGLTGAGTTITSGGVTSGYLPVGTTYAPGTTGCLSGSTLLGSTCQVTQAGTVSTAAAENASSNGSAGGDGTLGQGGNCDNNANACASGFVCQVNTSDGNDTCVSSSSATGQIACDVGSVPAGTLCAKCSDGSTADTGSDCPGGNATVPGNDTVGQGGDCEENASACSSGLICQTNANGDDTCVSSNGATGESSCDVGSVPAGTQCTPCWDGSNADTAADCPANPNSSSQVTSCDDGSSAPCGFTCQSGNGVANSSECQENGGQF